MTTKTTLKMARVALPQYKDNWMHGQYYLDEVSRFIDDRISKAGLKADGIYRRESRFSEYGPWDYVEFNINNPADALALFKALAEREVEIYFTKGDKLWGEKGWYWVRHITEHERRASSSLFSTMEEAMAAACEALEL